MKRIKRIKWIILILILYAVFNPYLAEKILYNWEIQAIPIAELQQSFDAGIVLGDGLAWRSGDGSFKLGISGHRLTKALEYYNRGLIHNFILSGKSDIKTSKHYLIDKGVPDTCIFVDYLSYNTYDNARNTATICYEYFPHGSFLLFTSGSHLRRAKASFDKKEILVFPVSTFNSVSERAFKLKDLLPSLRSLSYYKILLHEMGGYFYYVIAGYI